MKIKSFKNKDSKLIAWQTRPDWYVDNPTL